MKQVSKIVTLIMFVLNTNSAFAMCDWKNDIKENSNGTYTYSRDCHDEVGKTLRVNGLLGAKIDLLEKQIELKDLQISKYDERTQLWMNTSNELNEKLIKYQSVTTTDKWVSFGLGVAVTVLSVWAAGQLNNN